MADNFQTLGSVATVQVTGPQSAVDVLRITFVTKPSGIIATANAPYRNIVGVRPGDVEGIARVFIEPLATGIERMMGMGIVPFAIAVEDTDASGLLIDYIDASVEYVPPGAAASDFQQVVRIPTGAFDEPSFFNALVGQKIGQAYEGLKALADV